MNNTTTNKPNFSESQKTLLKEAFQDITDYCNDSEYGRKNVELYKKDLNHLINVNIRWGETLETAIDNAYWAVIGAIDVDKRLDSES